MTTEAKLTKQVKQLARDCRMDLVGIAGVDR